MDWGSASLPVASGALPLAGPCVVVHGGAWDIPTDEVDAHLAGLRRALARARQRLLAGRTALDVVVETVAVLETYPAFDAGRGAVLDRDGRPQLDAGVMDGQSLRWGAVANVRTVANPVRLAGHLVEADGQARFLVGEGAERFASEIGLPYISPEALIVPREQARFDALRARSGFHTSAAFSGTTPAASGDGPRGTVGCVVLDAEGRLAAATSTGGAPHTRPGRVGDSPIVGAGFWADSHSALSATGWGEAIATVQLCASASGEIQRGMEPERASADHLADMRERIRWPGTAPATGGLIALDASGRAGWAFTTPRMARGSWSEASGEWVAVDR